MHLVLMQHYLEHMPVMSIKNVLTDRVHQIYRLYKVHRWEDSEQKDQHAVWLRYSYEQTHSTTRT